MIKPDKITSNPAIDPSAWIDEHGDYLFSFAMMRVRDKATAEDLVQETLLSAIQATQSYAGKSTERTWLTSILKFKVVDYYRKHSRETALEENVADTERFFENKGGMRQRWVREIAPRPWNTNPQSALENSEFQTTLEDCLMKLPEQTASTFILQQIDGLSCGEISDILGVSTSNCWVMLHRARLNLRHCIESNWFGKK